MLESKSHFGYLVFDDDHNKTLIANTRLEAIEWWGILEHDAKLACLKEHSIDKPLAKLNWKDLLSMYRSKHNVL